MADDKKIDRLSVQCTVSYKKKIKKISRRQEMDMSSFIIMAINEKIKNDGLEEE